MPHHKERLTTLPPGLETGTRQAHPKRSQVRKSFLAIPIFGLPITIIIYTSASLWRSSPKERMGYLATFTILVILGLVAKHFPVIDRASVAVIRTLIWLFLYDVVVALTFLVFRWLSTLVIINLHLRFQIIVLFAWGLILAGALVLIATESGRKRMFELLRAIGNYAPLVYSFIVLLIAVMYFSTVTYILASKGILSLIMPPEHAHLLADPILFYGKLQDFFIWHILEDIPVLHVNQTLRWAEPLTYTSPAVGFIVLIFKITVIVPVTAAFVASWKRDEGTLAMEQKQNH
jgi:hypothetical protein